MIEKYRLKKIAKLIEKKSKILDLGCSAIPNPFLKNKEVCGLDLNEKLLPTNYTNFIKGDVFDMPILLEEYEVNGIVAGEIIEHLHDPVAFLKNCHQVLQNNGLIVLSTPNPNSIIERLLTLNLSRKFFYTQDHIMLYPQRWLIRIMEIAGFSNIKLYSGGMIFPVLGTIPFPRTWCYQTIATGVKN